MFFMQISLDYFSLRNLWIVTERVDHDYSHPVVYLWYQVKTELLYRVYIVLALLVIWIM